jgi:hypothetical protein
MELNRKDETIRKQGIFYQQRMDKRCLPDDKTCKILPAFIALEIAEKLALEPHDKQELAAPVRLRSGQALKRRPAEYEIMRRLLPDRFSWCWGEGRSTGRLRGDTRRLCRRR